MTRRVVVTGLGLICGVGNSTEEVWKALVAGKSGVARITGFDAGNFACQIAAEVKNFDPLNYIEKKELKKMGRFIHLAIAASDEALKMSELKITPENAEHVGVHIGSGIGGFDIIEREHAALVEGGPRKISPFFIPAAIINLAAGHVSMRHGAKGPNEATATACTTSAHSVGDSFRIIQHNDADVMIAGGAEAAITPMGVGGFAAMRALSTRNDEPERASRPWDQARDGFVMGEGSGIMILEELEHARKRGAPILAEVVGYGMSADAYHMTQPAPEHEGGFRVMRNAVRDAGVTPGVIGYVNAHGTSTPIGDTLEAHAIRNFFGQHKVAVSSTKSMTGHLLGGAGGLEAGITVLALRDQMLPPTINLENPDPDTAGMDLVPNHSRKAEIEYAMSNSFGFGGTNGALLFRRWSE
ncbi:3-oxoacyl-(acyl-carrier-protein) synthase II [Candidatus Sulfotelmatobacter kueseliae]|uniref:3-oxoacyl-[acyl-carrier-protein] synthase 2 n=1 Tax=Candidatus Sulfotelmatobacter kueseliae TaxID=2042962 RepID=A0A2U3KYG2_9BACT|nr:3-oxoacyl-(acyl-carrier-protein) synthase II [Candidatus Sulfotelmatobacter kueseliae]